MIVVNLDPEQATLIPVDKTRFQIEYQSESESKVTILITPKEPPPTKENDE